MATKSDAGRGPAAITEGYSISGSQANSVALKPGGTFSGGKRFSVAGPVDGGESPTEGVSGANKAEAASAHPAVRKAVMKVLALATVRNANNR